MPTPNRYLEAFKESYNAVGLASAAALSAALLNPLPLIVGVVAEAAYLLTVPDSKWYGERLSKRNEAANAIEAAERRRRVRDETLPRLRPEMQERFAHLEAMRSQIDAQAQQDKAWFQEVLRKLDYLLEKFLLFAGKEVEFRTYLDSLHDEVQGERGGWRKERDRQNKSNRKGGDTRFAPSLPEPRNGQRNRAPDFDLPEPVRTPSSGSDRDTRRKVEEVQAHYEQDRKEVEAAMESESDFDTQAVLRKRVDVLERRHEFAGKIGRILTNINHQLQLTEDTFGLINDEIRARSPEQILSDIDEVVIATNTMASALEELAPIDQMVARLSS